MIRVLTILLLIAIVSLSALSASEKPNRIKVETVEFEGINVFDSKRLASLMLTRTSGFLAPSYFYPEVLNDDLDNLIIFYQQNGYLDAKIPHYDISIDSLRSNCKIKITVSEGEVYKVSGISLFGNHAVDDSTLRAQTKLRETETFKRNLVQEDQLAILSFYAENGFLDAVVKPDLKINSESHTGFIDYLINENEQFSIGNTIIKGNEYTQDYVVQRELQFKAGQIVKYSDLLSSQRQLYATGLFESVFITPQSDSADPSRKNIFIDLNEKKSSELNFLIGYGSEDKARTRLEYNTNNLAGTGRKIGFAIQASFLRRAIGASFTDPRIIGTRWQLDINSGFEFLEQPGYDVSRLKNVLSIGRPIGGKAHLKSSFRYEDAKLRHIEVIEKLETFNPRIRSISLVLTYDGRDDLFDPRSGLYIEFSNEVSGAFLSGSNTFSRSVLILKHFFDLNNKTILGSSLEIGYIDHLGSLDEIPLSERFYSGGTNSIRGFEYQMVGPRDVESHPLGGELKIVWNAVEIRRSLYKLLGLVLFFDVGNVWEKSRDFNLNDFRTSVGFGLRFGSPIGILRLDYGINLDKRDNEPRGLLHFNMGHIF